MYVHTSYQEALNVQHYRSLRIFLFIDLLSLLTHCGSLTSTKRADQFGLKAEVHTVDANVLFIKNLQEVQGFAARMCADDSL